MGPREFDVPVAGGTLRVCRWPGDGPVVLATHGITANALSWATVARGLTGRAGLVAPDLRGRALSAALPGPYGMAAHADDLVAVLDHLGVERAPIVGHSMGAWVATVAAVRHPDRISSVLLVDGGVALPVPPGADIDEILQAVIGPAMRRLSMTFESPQAYLDFWRAHPALAAAWSADIERYVLRDLAGDRSSCSLEAVRADAADVLLDEPTVTAVRKLPCPARLLWARRGMMDDPQGFYDEDRLAYAAVDGLATECVEGVNHYTILLTEPGVTRVTAVLLRDLG